MRKITPVKQKPNLKITLDKPEFRQGEYVQGKILLTLSKEKKNQQLIVFFDAIEAVSFTYYYTTKAKPCFEINHFLEEKKILWDSNEDDEKYFTQREFPFKFLIPDSAPQSFSRKKNEIRYEITAIVQKKRLKSLIDKIDVRVFPSLKEKPVKNSSMLKETKNISCLVEFEREIFDRIDEIVGRIILKKLKKCKLKKIICTLFFNYDYEAKLKHGSEKRSIRENVIFDKISLKNIDDKKEIPIKFNLPGRGEYSLKGKLINISWGIHFKIEIGLKKDINITFPITISPLKIVK